jgi:hypothetical protein
LGGGNDEKPQVANEILESFAPHDEICRPG